jgi:CBS domain-containing protein
MTDFDETDPSMVESELQEIRGALFNDQIAVLGPAEPVCLREAATVQEAIERMLARRQASVLVLDADGRLVGIFTERDAVCRVLAARRDSLLTKVAEVMTRDPVTVSPDETFGYALLLMHDNGFRHAPVVENGRPIGVVSMRHALDPELEEFTAEAERRKSIRRLA